MKKLFAVFIIFSLIVFGQQRLLSDVLSRPKPQNDKIISHEHAHSLATILAMAFLGILSHSHDHNHTPWDDTQNHDSNAHEHYESQKIKVDFISCKASVKFAEISRRKFLEKKSHAHYFEYTPDIFRPPINS